MNLCEQLPIMNLQRTRQSAPQVFELLREAILSVRLKPGAVLKRVELAKHFGVSQTPIRDALQRLSELGLVDVFAQHTTVVSRIDTQAALQIHFMRRALEIEILKTICKLPPAELGQLLSTLRSNLKEQKKSLTPLNFSNLAILDIEFHRAMYEAANVGPLWTLIREKSADVDRLRQLNLPQKGKAKSVVADHEAIFSALEARDEVAIENALRKHLSGTLGFIDEIKENYPDYVS